MYEFCSTLAEGDLRANTILHYDLPLHYCATHSEVCRLNIKLDYRCTNTTISGVLNIYEHNVNFDPSDCILSEGIENGGNRGVCASRHTGFSLANHRLD